MLHPAIRTALFSRPAPTRPPLGASVHLIGETQGAAFDFTSSDGLGAISVVDTGTAANNRTNVQANDLLSVTRNSTKLLHNSAGGMTSFAVNTPAIQWDGAEYGLLVEPAATNLCLQSQTLATSPWGVNNAAVAVNNTTAPDGTTTAEKITESSGAGIQNIYQSIAAFSSNTDYALSVYAKAGTQSSIGIYLTKGGNGEEHIHATFNLATGATGETDVGTTSGTVTSSSITALGNGWYRCVLVGKITETTGYFCVTPLPQATGNTFDASGEVSYTGTGKTVFLWGAQMELGTIATSYVPTTTVAVTRAADVVTLALTSLPFSATEGTVIAHWKSAPAAAAQVVWQIDDTGGNERILAYRDASNNPLFAIVDGGVAQTAIDLGTLASSTVYKSAFAWKLNDTAASLNGGAATADTSATLPTVTTLRFGADHSASYLNSTLRRLIYIPRRLLDAELVVKTT